MGWVRRTLTASAMGLSLCTGVAAPSIADETNLKHYLVVQGENFWPVGAAFATPFVTLFRIDEAGYVPSSSMTPANDKGLCHATFWKKDRHGNSVSSSMAADAAVASEAEASYAFRGFMPGCPRDIGAMSAGSYLYDNEGNEFGAFDFPEGIRGYTLRSAADESFITFPIGGKGADATPAIKQMTLSGIVMQRHPDAPPTDDGSSKMKIAPYIPGAPELPVVVTYNTLDADDDPGTPIIDDALIDTLKAHLDGLLKRGAAETEPAAATTDGDVLVVLRGKSPRTEEEAKRLEARIAKINALFESQWGRGKVTTVSFGQELPICSATTQECWSVNRSAFIYHAR